MSNVSIGITAMELFAYNPFRIMGMAVNTPQADIENNYKKLLDLADSGDIAAYKTPFDFDSLPPFSRSAQTVKTAYAKLASNGYRCFAYSDSQFLVSLNIDDIALNLREISCYDCFLRCYMWLIINDREMQERDLWIQLAKHIDAMIMSTPDEWSRVFDHRFPNEMVNVNMNVYKAFYSTFCEIILLPLKEMVRGSMKCRSATEILECAKIDVNEEFEFIDIPQANVPKPGHPQPKLKLAVKDGEEYFDITSGQIKSYSTDTVAAESNQFADSDSAPLDADMLISDDEGEVTEEEVYEEPVYEEEETEEYEQTEDVYEEPSYEYEPEETAVAEEIPEETETAEEEAPADSKPAESSSIRRPAPRKRPAERTAADSERKPPKPTEPVAPKPEPLKLNKEPVSNSLSQSSPAPRRTRRTVGGGARTESAAPSASSAADFSAGNPFFKAKKNNPEASNESVAPKNVGKSYTKVVSEAEKEADTYTGEEEDENAYTAALIQMLKANQMRGHTMKSVDTKHMADMNSKEMTVPVTRTASMDAINMDKMDSKLLEPSADLTPKKLTREQRYRDIKIDDMLGTNMPKNYTVSAIDEYKKNKAKDKANMRTILALTGVLCVIIGVFAALAFFGII